MKLTSNSDKNFREGTDKYRLPTEAECEYACRAGGNSRFCYGNDEDLLVKHSWFKNNSGAKTHPVARKQPNKWGLFDIHGNVWEWCSDLAGKYPENHVIDPMGPKEGIYRVYRGSSWSYSSWNNSCANRKDFLPSYSSKDLGFRLIRDLD